MKLISLNRLLFIIVAYNSIFLNAALAENTEQLQKTNTLQQPSIQEIKQLKVKSDKNQPDQLESNLESLNTILKGIQKELKVPWYESPSVTVLLGFILGLIPAWIGNFKTDRKEKNQLSYQLAKEWDSYREDRNEADKIFVKNNPGNKYFSEYTPKEKTHMHKVIEFFDRVDMARKNKMINTQAVRDYLSRDYKEWEERYFSEQRKYYNRANLPLSEQIYSNLFKEPYEWLMPENNDNQIIENDSQIQETS